MEFVDGFKIFDVTEKQALRYIKLFDVFRNEKKDYQAMAQLFDEALGDEKMYDLLLLNAWRSLTEVSNQLKEQMQ